MLLLFFLLTPIEAFFFLVDGCLWTPPSRSAFGVSSLAKPRVLACLVRPGSPFWVGVTDGGGFLLMNDMREKRSDFENSPLTRPEYISAMVHFYRGELNRANTWRLRLDTTTNWAILTVTGLLSFAFGVESHTHGSIVLGMFLVLHYLTLEARRYRFFDVWRNRVRKIEENFYGPLLTRDLHSPEHNWGKLVAKDLLRPGFKITYMQAFKARFKANYIILYLILGLSWALKLLMHPHKNTGSFYQEMSMGPIPWYVIATIVLCLYLFFLGVILFVSDVEPADEEYWGHDNPLGHIRDF